MEGKTRSRLLYIDVARTYAIFLALLSHAFVAIGLFEQLGSNEIYVRQFTRMATPMFVFMFGFMVEFIYVRKTETNGYGSVNKRIFIRSFQCYVAYALTIFCAFLGGYKSLEGFFASLLFFTDSRFGNILRAYSLILLITPFVIKMRLKYGVKLLFICLTLLIVGYSFIDNLSSVDFKVFNHPLNVLFGFGLHKGGPSVLGAISFFLGGMIVASGLRSKSHKKNIFNSMLLLFILVVTGIILIDQNFHNIWLNFSDGIYRKNNSPGYYIIGIIGSILTISLIQVLVGSRNSSAGLKRILPLGTSSLISYTAGNMILNLIGVDISFLNPILFLFIFFSVVLLITSNIEKMPFYMEINKILNLNFSSLNKKLKFR